ncbi:MAG: hypothetical protein PHH00_02860 [Candidatus Nanoarchaeia archaeon]|nr:hypothetical protein [Candidatus Nanoarchaeia archaeon]
MKNKILIAIIAVLVVIGVVAYFAIANPFGWGAKPGTAEGTTITSLHLESFPEGTQIGAGMTGTETTSFKIGEMGVVVAEVTADGSVTATIGIYQNATLVTGQPCVEIVGTGGFGCSLGYPQTPGTYTLKLYIEDIEKTSLDFEVTQ